MSRLRIEHRTTYSYRQAVGFGRHRLVLRPREGHDLNVESMTMEIRPAHRLLWARDVYSNSVAIVDFVEEAAQLDVHSTVTVMRSLPFPREDPWGPCSIDMPVAYDELEAPVAASYQLPSYPEDLVEVQNWLHDHPAITASGDAEVVLMTLCSIIHEQIKYQKRMLKGVQSPGQTLKLRSGSCRDMATLMMDAARQLGMAARFASGYLDCPASEVGRASMHAWTEVYLPILGWRGFDPTLGEATSLKHIVVGVSHHPRGVMPISGMFTGASADYLDMVATVKIEKVAEGLGAGD